MNGRTKTSLRAKVAPRRKKITFGDVSIWCDVPSEADVKRNASEGKAVFLRLLKALQTPGVDLEFKRDVPYFHAAPGKPGYLIRTLNGNEETVVLKNGEFVVCE